MAKPSWLQNLSLLIISTLLFGAGFYFGYKNGAINSISNSSTSTQQVTKSSIGKSSSISTSVPKPLTEVYWIKPGIVPQCPDTHLIKGVFDSNSGWFYTKENSRYSRINPDICFISEEFASTTAGFIKKF